MTRTQKIAMTSVGAFALCFWGCCAGVAMMPRKPATIAAQRPSEPKPPDDPNRVEYDCPHCREPLGAYTYQSATMVNCSWCGRPHYVPYRRR